MINWCVFFFSFLICFCLSYIHCDYSLKWRLVSKTRVKSWILAFHFKSYSTGTRLCYIIRFGSKCDLSSSSLLIFSIKDKKLVTYRFLRKELIPAWFTIPHPHLSPDKSQSGRRSRIMCSPCPRGKRAECSGRLVFRKEKHSVVICVDQWAE